MAERTDLAEPYKEDFEYDELTTSERIDQKLLDRIETLTKRKSHRFLRRQIFYSHRDMDCILDAYEQKKPFYIYTGRAPSARVMHVGKLITFIFAKYLQDVFDVPLVIQMTDDEVSVWTNMTVEEANEIVHDNVKDIISCGFDVRKTFIFSNLEYMSSEPKFYSHILRIQKCVTLKQLNEYFGFEGSDRFGKVAFTTVQAAPSFPTAFPKCFGDKKDIHCLIPCVIDQDPFFRMSRDLAPTLGFIKPALIYSIFFPALKGLHSKMDPEDETSAIFLTDTNEQIEEKIGNAKANTTYQYLRFFMEDDAKFEDIKKKQIETSDLKKELTCVLQEFIMEHKRRRSNVTDQIVKEFMTAHPLI